MKKIIAAVVISSIASFALPAGFVNAASTFDRNMKNAETVYERQRDNRQRRRYKQYLKNYDHYNGTSQRTGPAGGNFTDKNRRWGGYRWSTK